MLNPYLFQNGNLPYQPLPEAAYQAARASLLKLNFSGEAILDDYSFSAGSRGHTIKVNALTFAHPVHRNPAEYASFTLYNAVNGLSDEKIVPMLAESSAPFHLIHRDGRFAFWASAFRNNKPEPIHVKSGITYDQLDEALSQYSVDLQPPRIIEVKRGRDTFTLPIFRDIYPLQLSLWAADVTRDLLVNYFARAVEVLRRHARQRRDSRAYDFPVTSLAVQLLGAIILADTGVLDNIDNNLRLEDATLNRLMKAAHAKFDTYFEMDVFDTYSDAAEEAYRILRSIRYSGFVPDMLSEVYVRAYSREQRKKQGRYDTPLYLTRRIWENIPVEYLPPDHRYVVDMTCGWGSFLITGHERLTNLYDTRLPLREFLWGNDNDPFTAKLAGLGLLLATSEDSWHVDHEDALEWKWLGSHQPGIIVGNPPFGADRKLLVGQQTRQQAADKFLAHAIERLAPNGYLAMLMPRSFTVAEASPNLRKYLLEVCDVFELWELPANVFPSDVTVRTMVLFAQKKARHRPSFQNAVRIRTVQPETQRFFEQSGPFTASSLVSDESDWSEEARKSKHSINAYMIDYFVTLPEHIWKDICSSNMQLSDTSVIFLGAIEGKKPENKLWKDYPLPRRVPWLTTVKNVIKRPFFIDYEQATVITYPNDLEKPRKNEKHPEQDKEKYLEGTKVLVASDPEPTWGKRVKVAIERKKHFVSNSFWVIVPDSSAQNRYITHEVIASILDWYICNAWIIERMRYSWIPERAINTVPFPKDLSQDDCQILTEAVWQLEAAAKFDEPAPLEVTQKIDSILKAAYHLDDATFERLRKISEWDSNPQTTLDPIADISRTNWILSGVVDRINAEEGTITFWMEGFEELQTVQIASSMPGWMLRQGAAFRTKIPEGFVEEGSIDRESIDWGTFYPQPYTYMSQEELFEELAKRLHEDDKQRIS